jgi:PPM family protein phosphatase
VLWNPCKLTHGRALLATALVHYSAAAVSDRGRKRPTNEDAFGYSIEQGVFLLCDGMGGAAAGEVASSLAVDEMMRVLSDRAPEVQIASFIEEAVNLTNQVIYSRAQSNSKLSGMGTTLVALVAEERRIQVLNIGDSRCYRLRAGNMEQITQDHSLVDEQVRLGRMSMAEAVTSPLRNIITRALGTQSRVTPDIFDLEAEPGDLFLLCSDGLTRELSDAGIESILANGHALDEKCIELVNAANQAGGADNITCVLVRVGQ